MSNLQHQMLPHTVSGDADNGEQIFLNLTSVYGTSGASNFQQLKKTTIWVYSDSTQLQGS